MVSRRDDLRAHRLRMQRITAAVLTGRTDPSLGRPPTGTAALIGGSVTAAALATVALYAVLTGGSAWRHGGSVIVEKETGTRLVLVGGVLHPVLNYASARLVLGSADPPIAVVPHTALASTTHGPTIGISGAPDVIPAASALDADPWTVCSVPGSGGSVVVVGVAAARAVAGGRNLGTSVLPVTDGDGGTYLIAGLRLARVVGASAVFAAMRWRDEPGVAVGDGVLGLLPVAPEVSADRLPVKSARLLAADPDSTVCVRVSTEAAASAVTVGAKVRASAGSRVVVTSGRGVLVRSVTDTGAPGPLYLLTDAGRCFPIADTGALTSLGYASAPVVTMPSAVVALLARGPTLSRTAALTVAAGGSK